MTDAGESAVEARPDGVVAQVDANAIIVRQTQLPSFLSKNQYVAQTSISLPIQQTTSSGHPEAFPASSTISARHLESRPTAHVRQQTAQERPPDKFPQAPRGI